MIVKVAPISSELELQLKNWVLEPELEPSVLWELSQDRGSNSAFRKGLPMNFLDIFLPAASGKVISYLISTHTLAFFYDLTTQSSHLKQFKQFKFFIMF